MRNRDQVAARPARLCQFGYGNLEGRVGSSRYIVAACSIRNHVGVGKVCGGAWVSRHSVVVFGDGTNSPPAANAFATHRTRDQGHIPGDHRAAVWLYLAQMWRRARGGRGHRAGDVATGGARMAANGTARPSRGLADNRCSQSGDQSSPQATKRPARLRFGKRGVGRRGEWRFGRYRDRGRDDASAR